MANPDHVALIKKGVGAWNEWRDENPDIIPDLSGEIFNAANISEADLRDGRFGKAELHGVDFHQANLSHTYLFQANLRKANLRTANLTGANLSQADLLKANITWANLHKAILIEADLSWSNLTWANLREADLLKANLSEAILHGANLRKANLTWANLIWADLSKANLIEANLTGANLSHANLFKADLSWSNLSEANLREADLRGADLIKANLTGANLSEADLTGANLSGANLQSSVLVNANFTDADLTSCRIYGVSAWGVKLDRAKQQNLVVTPVSEPEAMVDDLEVAQFFYLLLKREKIRNVIDAVTRRGVLILGRFGDGGLPLLQAIAAWLRNPENAPLLFDFPPPESKTYTDTVRILVGLARFVIVDLSGPSVPQEITATVDLYEIPFVPILEEKRKDWSMFRDFLVKERVLEPVRFTDQNHLLELLAQKVIAPAEKLIEKRQKRLDEIFGRASPKPIN